MHKSGSWLATIIGIDLIYAADGSWRILEANDSPFGLALADSLNAGVRGAAFVGRSTSALVAELALAGGGDGVLALLPEGYRYIPEEARESDAASDRERFELTEFHRQFNILGCPFEFRGLDEIEFVGSEVWTPTLGRPGCVYVNLIFKKFPECRIDQVCVNDLRVRQICRDKWATHKIGASAFNGRHSVKTGVLADRHGCSKLLDEVRHDNGYVLLKPRFGSGGMGITRLRAREFEFDEPLLESYMNSILPLSNSSHWLLQEWIPSGMIRSSHRPYQFDVRVYLVNGVPLSGLVCSAAAPADAGDSGPLSWLTTLGKKSPLLLADSPASTNSSNVAIRTSVRDELVSLVRRFAQVIEGAASTLEYEEVISEIPNHFPSVFDLSDGSTSSS
jgi:hypothetical protein